MNVMQMMDTRFSSTANSNQQVITRHRRPIASISSRRETMSHMFFNHTSSIAQHAAMHDSFVPASYDLNILPNAIHDGLLVEADYEGSVVAIKFPDGQTMRSHSRYIVHRTPTENLFVDINRIVHPLD